MDADVVVVGGGAIGTAIAWRAAASGRDVILIDPGAGASPAADAGPNGGVDLNEGKASLVAAGMLAPVSESVFGEESLLALNLLALDRFPAFCGELEAAAGQETGLRAEGTLNVAYDSGDLAALSRLAEFRRGIGLPAETVSGRECRRLEPFLASNVVGGLLVAGDLSVDNRRYFRALRAAAARAGVRVVAATAATIGDGTVSLDDGDLNDGDMITATSVVAAAGWAVSRLPGVPDAVRRALRPVKGQILRLRHPAALPPVITRTVRALVVGRDVYLVPRLDGEIVVGATQEERDDTDITAGAVHDILRDAMAVLPAVSELILAEASAGLRPGSADNGPIVGRAGGALIVAAGHFRNGILLSAATADAVTALLDGKDPAPQWAPFTPGRFT